MSATRPPASRAAFRYGIRWMLLCFGLAPQMMMKRACAKSGKSTLAILPYSASEAAPVGAAQTVRASRDAPIDRNSRSSVVPWVRSPFDPP